MKITAKKIKAMGACEDGYQWYLDNGTSDLKETLFKVNKVNPSWASWLYTRLMTVKQRRVLAVYAAEKVLPIFEKKYPNDNRPRLAIKAVKLVIKSNTSKNRAAAYAATNAAAYAAANAAYAAYAAAAYAAANAAYAYAADADAARLKMQETLIKRAVKILESK